MDLNTAMLKRHSVRAYLDRPIEAETRKQLVALLEACNREGDLHMQLITDEPKAFDCFLAHYGKFSGVKNYIALIGKKSADLEEKIGYYGERIALYAQTLGLNTCWVASTYKKIKTAFQVEQGEKFCLVLAIGYGKTQGVAHRQKSAQQVSVAQNPPKWFERGIAAALLAPTALNQQKFTFTLDGNGVKAKAGFGVCTKIDLGIAKYHFELGAGTENFAWIP